MKTQKKIKKRFGIDPRGSLGPVWGALPPPEVQNLVKHFVKNLGPWGPALVFLRNTACHNFAETWAAHVPSLGVSMGAYGETHGWPSVCPSRGAVRVWWMIQMAEGFLHHRRVDVVKTNIFANKTICSHHSASSAPHGCDIQKIILIL